MSLLLLAIAIACRSVSELQQHGKLRWSKDREDFWGNSSWIRKYYLDADGRLVTTKDSWYTRLFKLKYREAFPMSATFLVAFTDGYHLTQSLFFLSLSASFSLATGVNFFAVWGGIVFIHAITYRILSR